jgi:hypothetical protein
MNPLQHQFIKDLLRVISCCLCVNSYLHATPSKLESNSPFLPPGYSELPSRPPEPPQRPSSPLSNELEFRGVVQLDGIYHFSLFKKSENKSYWISEDGSESGIGISDFDVDSMNITVTVDGRSEQLTLMAASNDPMPVVAQPPQLPTPVVRPPNLPAEIQQLRNTANEATTSTTRRRTIPRRRVIVPNKR